MASQQQQQRHPPQTHAHLPTLQRDMRPQPETIRPGYRAAQKLAGRVVLVTAGDNGIGRAVAVHCAHEGARVAVAYFDEHDDARQTARMVEDAGSECLLIAGDLCDQEACRRAVEKVVARFGGLDVLVNNATGQRPVDAPDDLDSTPIERTFRTNAFAYLYLMTAALPYLPRGGSIINTSSDSSVHGHRRLIDYAATHGAVQAMTCSFAEAVADRGIRVNAVAAGPIWTPLVPSTFDAGGVNVFGCDTLLKRAGQPSEVAPAYVFLASQDASYITGQTIHINGGGHISA